VGRNSQSRNVVERASLDVEGVKVTAKRCIAGRGKTDQLCVHSSLFT